MGKIRMRSAAFSDNPELKAPVFNFSEYIADGHHTYFNNEEKIDFVTDGNSLYVCLSHDGVTPTYENIEDNGDFLKIVSQGPQGIRGPRGHDGESAETQKLSAEFDNDQLRVYVNGELETISPRLTGKAWRPKLEDNMIVWELSNKTYTPEPIDLEELRPIQERPLLLRVDSDNTKRSDETSGPAGFIQWKYEGDPHWTNLISISELMNLTLAGVSIWKNDEGKWHFGHRKVVSASYESDKAGNRIISNVVLDDVLFDAGELPFEENSDTRPDYSIDIDLIYTRLAEIEGAMVKSVNNIGPDPATGNVNINIPTIPSLEPYAQKDWVNSNFQPKGNYVKSVRINGVPHSPNASTGEVDLGDVDTSDCVKSIKLNDNLYTPTDGLVDLGRIGGGSSQPGEGDGVGVDNIEFRLSGNSLEYHVSINGVWQPNWTPIPLPSGSTGGGEHIELSIEDGALYISRNGGTPEYVGPVGNASGNWVKDITKSGNTLVITYWDNTTNTITIPEGGSSTVLVQPVLTESANTIHIATITVNGNEYKIYAPKSSNTTPVNPDDPSNPGGTAEDGITLDLTNEINTIAVDKNNKTLSTASFLTELQACKGGYTEIEFDQDDVTITVSPNINGISVVKNIDNNPKKFQINVNSGITISGEVKIAFTLWANDLSRIARTVEYTLVPLRLSQSEMFYLELNPNIIKVDSEGNYTSETISALPHWLLDGDPQSIVGWNDSSKINDVTVKYHVYYKIDNGNYTFYTSPVDITSASDQAVFELRYYYNNNKTDYIVMDGPEHVLILRDGQNGQPGQPGTRLVSQTRYYQVNNESTGITAPATNVDPTTLPEESRWYVSTAELTLDSEHQYLWFFERIVYSDGYIYQSPATIARYFNPAIQEAYEEIESAVEERIGERLTQLSNRLDGVDHTYADVNITSEDALVEILADYVDQDNGNKSFAEIIVDGKGAEIAQAAGLVTSTQMTGVTSRLSAVEGSITNAVDQQTLEGAINSSEQRMTANLISQTVTAADSKWHKVVNEQDTYQNYSPGQNETVAAYNARMIADGWELVVMSDKMSAIEQKADQVSILVGQNGNVKAGVIVDAINNSGSSVQINADHIVLDGQTIARTIEASQVDIKNAQNESTVILTKNGIDVRAGSLGGGNGVSITSSGVTLGSDCSIDWDCVTGDKPSGGSDINSTLVTKINQWSVQSDTIIANNLKAKNIDAEYLTVDGQPISADNSLDIAFGDSSTSTTAKYTLYFLY